MSIVTTLPCFGITITQDAGDREKATISSSMIESHTSNYTPHERSIKAIETMILEHFIAGIDVSEPGYLTGIEATFEGAMKEADDTVEVSTPEGKLLLTLSRRITASVDEEIDYLVDEKEYRKALQDGEKPTEALQLLKNEGNTQRVRYEAEVSEVHSEFESSVSE